jgi:tetratricopeptide (TPR) repeat protein
MEGLPMNLGDLRVRIGIAVGCLLFLSASIFGAPPESFLKANEAYAAGDYQSARRLYSESLVHTPDENAWFNLGNACFRLNDLGHAALAYERALVLSPGHAEAAENLRFLRQKSGARADERSWLQRALGATPPAVAPWIAVAGAWLGFGWAGSALWRRTGSLGLIGGLFLVILSASYGAGVTWWRGVQSRDAIVIAAGTEAKSEPAAASQTAGALPPGSRVHIVSTVAGWHYCELPAGARGWLAATDVESIITPSP